MLACDAKVISSFLFSFGSMLSSVACSHLQYITSLKLTKS